MRDGPAIHTFGFTHKPTPPIARRTEMSNWKLRNAFCVGTLPVAIWILIFGHFVGWTNAKSAQKKDIMSLINVWDAFVAYSFASAAINSLWWCTIHLALPLLSSQQWRKCCRLKATNWFYAQPIDQSGVGVLAVNLCRSVTGDWWWE